MTSKRRSGGAERTQDESPAPGRRADDQSVRNLMGSARLAKDTKENYRFKLLAYLREAGVTPDQFVEETRKNPKTFERNFAQFLQKVSTTSSPSTVVGFRDSVKKFLEMNRVGESLIDWTFISEYVPKHKRFGEDRAPTLAEVRKIVELADLRMKCLVLFLCSSGARIGSIAWLRWRDIEEVELEGKKFAKITIYRGEPEQYATFITPECYTHLLDYRKFRESLGETVAPQSFVFVRELNKRNPDPTKIAPVTVSHLKNQVGELLRTMQMRGALESKNEYQKYEFKQVHGFRKFFKTRMEVAGVKPIITEMLMGHSIGVSNSYMKPSNDELVEEYARGIPSLTILHEEKTSVKNELKEQLLLIAGFKPEEIQKINLEDTTNEDFQRLVRERLLGAMANNGARQKVIPIAEVKDMIPQGWEYVDQLPTGEAIVRLPG